VFLAGAILKAMNINLFTVQISYYGVLAQPAWTSAAALGTLGLETGLGVALVLGVRLRGVTFAAVLALLAVFTGLIAYGWAFHNLKDCGCFGPIEISPGVSIAKNVVLAALAALAWWCSMQIGVRPLRWMIGTGKLLLVLGCAVGMAAYSYLHLESVAPTERPFAQFVFDIDGVPYDLGVGEYMVVMLSMTCEDCMASVPALNDLSLMPDLPPLVALCYEVHEGAMEEFRQTTDPLFPMYSLGDRVRLFFSLVGGEPPEPPRLNYVRDGERIVFWDLTIPSVDEVFAALEPYRGEPAR
jgi:hypothetical protein